MEHILLDCRVRGFNRLFGEDLRDVGGISGFVVPALPDLGERGRVGAVGLAECHRRDGDSRRGHAPDEGLMISGLTLTIREQDDMLDLGRDALEHLEGHLEAGIHSRAAPRGQGVDRGFDRIGFGRTMHGTDLERLTVEGHHAEMVLWPSKSTVAFAACRASSMGIPCMLPDLSITRTIATAGCSFSFS